MNVDYLIVGQGIAGALLSMELLRAGKHVLVIDEGTPLTASRKAGGLYNPVTGRKMVKTWLADQLFGTIESYYRDLESTLQGKFLYPKRIYRPFLSVEEQNDWAAKSVDKEYKEYIGECLTKSLDIQSLKDPYGGIVLQPSGFVFIPEMLRLCTVYLEKQGIYRSEVFLYDKMKMNSEGIQYGDVRAKKIIFCEGPRVENNPFWNFLPFKPVKGEIMDIEANLPTHLIINRGIFILPMNDYFRVGSTYDHETLDYTPTDQGIKELKERLGKIYVGDYKVIRVSAGIRPATYDRRPFIGMHPEFRQIGIFNGFGTKGVSLIPFFAHQYLNYLSGFKELDEEVDVKRVFLSKAL